MGIRFHKTVSLGKAARLNFSKSGVGLSLGVPGACVSIGPKGTLLSLGVPGTGVSYRKTTTALKSPVSVDNAKQALTGTAKVPRLGEGSDGGAGGEGSDGDTGSEGSDGDAGGGVLDGPAGAGFPCQLRAFCPVSAQ